MPDESLLDQVMKKLEGMSPQDLAELEKTVVDDAEPIWLPTVGPQYTAYFHPADELLYGGAAGGGKGMRLTDSVLTPFGWRKAGDIKVGDAICSTDGRVQHVLAVYPRGAQPVYKFTWSDGAETVVDGDHLWLGWWAGKGRKLGNVYTTGEAGARIWMTKDIFERASQPGEARFGIPMISAPCAFNVAGQKKGPHRFIKRTMPPYVLGVLLGDGTLSEKKVGWTKPDREIEVRVRALMEVARGGPVELSVDDPGDKCVSFRFLDSSGIKGELADLGLLGKSTLEKFIPRIYLLGSEEERWELLKGLMDTDGWVEEDGECYYGSSSEQLAKDVRHLAQSLGAFASMRDRIPTYTYNGDKLKGERAYTVRIKIPNPERMFTLARKIERCAGRQPQHMARFLDSIEPAGEAETVCFVVSNPNRLYIVDDFVVTHNTDLALGLAFTAHYRSLILRRQYVDLGGITERAIEINGSRDGYSGAIPPKLRTRDDRLIVFGAHKDPGDETSFQGQPFDLKVLDEAALHLESQLIYHLGWLRTARPGQRCRALLASNPPVDASGDWLIRRYRPWLDITHHKPAKHGELRWFITNPDGEDTEVDGPEPLEFEAKGQKRTYIPKSRTFIPSSLNDNPFLVESGYQATLDALPEPMRSAFRDGNFMVSRQDAAFQTIPTQWVIEAQARWKKDGKRGKKMTAMGYDPAGGGRDCAELAMRYDFWYDEIVTTKGSETTDGSLTVAHLFRHRRDNAVIVIDAGGGYAGQTTLRLRDNDTPFTAYNANYEGVGRDASGKLKFANHRAEVWWKFREALDPDQPGGAQMALPPDPELRADLTAPTYSVEKQGIKIESKDDIRKRLGRSPGKSDAVVMAWADGNTAKRKADNAAAIANRNNLPAYAQTRSGPLQRRRR